MPRSGKHSVDAADSQRPHGLQPTRLLRPWGFPGKSTGVGCHFLLQCMKVKSESEVAQSCLTLRDPMDCSPPGSSLSMGFSRQEYWSGWPCPSPGDLPYPRIEPKSLRSPPWQAGSLPLAPPGKPFVEEVVSEEGCSHCRENADMCVWMWGENVKACVYA